MWINNASNALGLSVSWFPLLQGPYVLATHCHGHTLDLVIISICNLTTILILSIPLSWSPPLTFPANCVGYPMSTTFQHFQHCQGRNWSNKPWSAEKYSTCKDWLQGQTTWDRSYSCPLLALWPWENYLTLISFRFLWNSDDNNGRRLIRLFEDYYEVL